MTASNVCFSWLIAYWNRVIFSWLGILIFLLWKELMTNTVTLRTILLHTVIFFTSYLTIKSCCSSILTSGYSWNIDTAGVKHQLINQSFILFLENIKIIGMLQFVFMFSCFGHYVISLQQRAQRQYCIEYT